MFRFRPAQRLLDAKAYSAVFSYRRVLRTGPFELYYRPSVGLCPRLGLVIPKRNAKRSVSRNLVKRLAREAFRHSSSGLPMMDLILRLGRPLLVNKPRPELQDRLLWRQQIDELLTRLPR